MPMEKLIRELHESKLVRQKKGVFENHASFVFYELLIFRHWRHKNKKQKSPSFFFLIEVQLERQKCQIKIPFDSFWSILNRKLLLTMKVYSSLSTYEIIANVNTISGSIDLDGRFS